MPALDERDYSEFSRMLEELAPEVENMKDTPRSFMSDMIAKNNEYSERVFVSVKQLNWIRQLHQEYVGDTNHDAMQSARDKEIDDDIPF